MLIDRISHEVPFYRTYLKKAVLQGVTVVNNPFMWSADDKFFGATLATKLGVAHPKTVVLPNKAYVPGIVPSESLRNLEFPLDWEGIASTCGHALHPQGRARRRMERGLRLPLAGRAAAPLRQLRPPDHGGPGVHPVGPVRPLPLLGQEAILPMPYDPRERRYLVQARVSLPRARGARSSRTRAPWCRRWATT